MKKLFMAALLFLLTSAMCAQENVICSFENGQIVLNNSFENRAVFAISEMPTNYVIERYEETVCYDFNGNEIKIKLGFDPYNSLNGFNEIKLIRSGNVILNFWDWDMWTYIFGGSKKVYEEYNTNKYYIPLLSTEAVTLIAFAGWSYGGDLPLLTIVAITSNEAKIVYNRHAVMSSITQTPSLEITIETVLLENLEPNNPVNEQIYHKIKYVGNSLIYE